MASSAGLVGLDLGTSGIRAVQVRRGRKGGLPEVVHAASVDLPRGTVRNGVVVEAGIAVRALRTLWKSGRFTTRRIAFGIADSGVMTRQVELPWMPPADFRTALRYQLGDALPVDLSGVELDYHPLTEISRIDDRGQEAWFNQILVVAANRDAVAAEANVLRKARLQPVAADSAAFALIRAACQGVLPDNSETHAMADIGADQSTVVVHQAGQPRFIRTIASLGGETATLAIAERLRVEPDVAERLKRDIGLNGPVPVVAPIAESSVFGGIAADETPLDPRSSATMEVLSPWAANVINEIRNSLEYYQASHPADPIRTLTLVGRTVRLDGMSERIATQIALPVRTMAPFAGLPASKKVMAAAVDDARYATAIGLALRSAP